MGHATRRCKVLEKFAAARNKGPKNQNVGGTLAGKNVAREDKSGQDENL